MRDLTLNLRINEDERRMARELADADGIALADLVRQCIRKMHRERFGEQPKKTRAAKAARS
jgi:predicted HicB family RNase H-like nuclease